MRISDTLFLVGLFVAGQAFPQKAPPDLKEKVYDVWDCKSGRTYPAPESGKLSAKEAENLARALAKKKGVDIGKFELSTVCFDGDKSNPSWAVFFDGVEPRPGNDFFVKVGDRNRSAELFWGK